MKLHEKVFVCNADKSYRHLGVITEVRAHQLDVMVDSNTVRFHRDGKSIDSIEPLHLERA